MNDSDPKEAATVCTWFEAVQWDKYLAQRSAGSTLAGSTSSNALFMSTLNAIVTRNVPVR